MLESLHFLRPWWLALLPITMLIAAAAWQLRDARQAWRGIIAPHLLDALLIRSEQRRRLLPTHLLMIAAVLAPLALAGPTWQREPSPFADETAVLVVALEVSESMLTEDVAPSRIERAGQKIADLLANRSDTDAALVAFSGSAHVAMPLTRDTEIVAEFAAALRPEIMPTEGDAAADALALATDLLVRSGKAGSILLVSDGMSESDVSRAVSTPFPVHVLAMGTGAIPSSLTRLAGKTGGSAVAVSPDARDIERLAARVGREIVQVIDDEDAGRWRDVGYWFLPILAVLTLAWSRPGWAIGYSGLSPGREPA